MARDDFTAKLKKSLAERAAHFCSNPHCKKLTIGPHTDASRSLSSGHAAHIHAASKGGPRYEPSQTTTQRKAISNGIWLCRECGDLVDKDTSGHTADELRRWRSDHEALVREVRLKGYSASLLLIQAGAEEIKTARRLVNLLEDRRALWAAFDAEVPVRVLSSLDRLRDQLVELREPVSGRPLDVTLVALTKTIHVFFDRVERYDLRSLRCDANDPSWREFSDSLAALRKSFGLQLANILSRFTLPHSDGLASLLPEPPPE